MPAKPTYRLTFDDDVEIWRSHQRGDYQYVIAARYPVNQGRVNDVLKGRLHPGARQVAERQS
jgi:hypothetical protein